MREGGKDGGRQAVRQNKGAYTFGMREGGRTRETYRAKEEWTDGMRDGGGENRRDRQKEGGTNGCGKGRRNEWTDLEMK